MYQKIYFNQAPLFLCDEITEEIEPYLHHDDAVFIDTLDAHTVKSMLHEMQLDKVHAGVFLHANLDELKTAFLKKLVLIQAGGGLVLNEEGAILLIFRKGKWDLPKGKLDEHETIEECAVREVEEETGLRQVKLVAPFTTTYHTYHQGTKFILKESVWYIMEVSGQQQLVPQTQEGIEEVKWVKLSGLQEYLDNCYPAVVDVLVSYEKKMNGQ